MGRRGLGSCREARKVRPGDPDGPSFMGETLPAGQRRIYGDWPGSGCPLSSAVMVVMVGVAVRVDVDVFVRERVRMAVTCR
jgi:hypothetical protein